MEYVVQGKKGNGKGIIAVAMIEDYLRQGKPVATNLDIFLEYLLPTHSKTNLVRLPDQPSLRDMECLGDVETGGDETKNGLIVLDECASWLNAREYSDKNRKGLLEWFLHSRKHGWDVVYIIQSINMLDKQFRDGFAEHLVTVVRLDRMGIPILSTIIKIFGFALRFPRIHVGIVRYGIQQGAPVVDKIYRRGKRYWKAYDTLQKFTPHNKYQGVSTQLSAFHICGRYQTRWEMYRLVMASSFLSGSIVAFLLTFVLLTTVGGYQHVSPKDLTHTQEVNSPVFVRGYFLDRGSIIATLDDGRIIRSNSFTETKDGFKFKVGNTWYREEGVK